MPPFDFQVFPPTQVATISAHAAITVPTIGITPLIIGPLSMDELVSEAISNPAPTRFIIAKTPLTRNNAAKHELSLITSSRPQVTRSRSVYISINIHPAQLEINPEPTAAVITDVSEPYLSQLESSLISFQEDQPSATATTLATKATVRA